MSRWIQAAGLAACLVASELMLAIAALLSLAMPRHPGVVAVR